jgi:hypothetical protein
MIHEKNLKQKISRHCPFKHCESVSLLEADVPRGDEAGEAGEGGEHGGKRVERLLVENIAEGWNLIQDFVHSLFKKIIFVFIQLTTRIF